MGVRDMFVLRVMAGAMSSVAETPWGREVSTPQAGTVVHGIGARYGSKAGRRR